MSFAFHPEALAEFEAAAYHYASISPALAAHFIASVEATIGEIVEQPLAGALLNQDIHRRLTRVFPYAVLYTVEPDGVLILAVMHGHRRPDYWRHRVSESP
jgi:Plasmid stabilization system protein